MLARLATVNRTISPSNSVLRGMRAVSAAISGAPMTTPRAYAEMTWPATGSVIRRPAAMSGSRPIATNSVVPMPNPPRASAITASHRTVGSGATTDMGPDGRDKVRVMVSTVDLLMHALKRTSVFRG